MLLTSIPNMVIMIDICNHIGYFMQALIADSGCNMSYRIRELRDMMGLSQKAFADKYEIPLSTLRKWEQGSAAPAPYVVKLIAAILPATDEGSVRVEYGDNIYYINSRKGTVSDMLGNEIRVSEDIQGVNEQNLGIL